MILAAGSPSLKRHKHVRRQALAQRRTGLHSSQLRQCEHWTDVRNATDKTETVLARLTGRFGVGLVSIHSVAMRIVAISDLHGYLPATVPRCDLLVIAGDVCPDFEGSGNRARAKALRVSEQQADWLQSAFAPWISRLPAAAAVMCWGNHDYVGEELPTDLLNLPVVLLTDNSCLIQGLTVYGTPWTTFAPTMWAFDVTADQVAARSLAIPSDVDILVSHGPALGVLDATLSGERAGSPALLEATKRIEPRLHLFGHIHEARGVQGFSYNVSLLDVRYRPYPLPLTEIDL